MTWTYLSTAPGSSARSYVRLRIGDVSSGRPMLQDEELDALLSMYGEPLKAASEACFVLAAQKARDVDKTAGRMSISNSQAAQAFERMGKRLLAEVGLTVVPYAGGISESDKDIDRGDTDLVQHSFTLGMHDSPGTAPQASTLGYP